MDLLERLALIPDEAREFDVPRETALAGFRIAPDLLDSLVARGLRHRPSPDGPVFSLIDLKNVSLHLGAGSSMLAARRFWAAGLNPPAGAEERQSLIGYRVRCPDPAHPGPCEYDLLTPGGWVRVSTGDRGLATRYEAAVTLATRWPELPGPYAELLAVTAGLDFMFLPNAIRYDLDFARRTGMCDCEGSSRLVVTEAERRGLPARLRSGLIVAPPFATVHTWAEFPIGDRWVPVDPVLLRSMIGWGALDPAVWHDRRSTGPVVVALGEQREPLARHGGEVVPMTLTTRWARRPVSSPSSAG